MNIEMTLIRESTKDIVHNYEGVQDCDHLFFT